MASSLASSDVQSDSWQLSPQTPEAAAGRHELCSELHSEHHSELHSELHRGLLITCQVVLESMSTSRPPPVAAATAPLWATGPLSSTRPSLEAAGDCSRHSHSTIHKQVMMTMLKRHHTA
jgi:hypothetical protein